MKALFITEPGKTEIREIAPPIPGPSDTLLRVRYVGLCGSDLNTFRGKNPLVSYPRIPGHEVGAIIEQVGREAPSSLQAGMEVTLSPYTNCGTCAACRQGRFNCCRSNQTLGVQRDGALTEYLVAPGQKVFPSRGLALRALALVEPLTVGSHAVKRGRVSAGETVAVLGCGAIGLGAVAAARARGAHVVAVDIDDAKLALARDAGAALTVNTRREALHERLSEATGGHGPEVVVEAAGLAETYRAAVEEVAFAGRVVYVGYAKQAVSFETRLFVQKELDVLGSRNATPQDFERVIAMLAAGSFPVERVITRTAPFDQAGEALREWDAHPADFTKILVEL
jgi:2-desacetyl-2-hydroxyethyl bacteriochlorophyllide A dehydrogenase